VSILVISGSLRAESRSRVLAQNAFETLQSQKADVSFVDLQDYPLPLCDGGPAYGHENVARIFPHIQKAKVILIGMPIYNYDVNAAIKNLVELTGKNAWEDKTVGFLCAAGGRSSYMSVMHFGNDLMLDFRCVIIPRFVYATGSDFNEPPNLTISNPEIQERIQQLTNEAIRFTKL
jgi:NAD(P)H-dependent FMN reductase